MAGDIKKALESAKPGWSVEEPAPRRAGVDSAPEERDMVGPDAAALKKKYLPHGSKGIDSAAAAAADAKDAAAEPASGENSWARLRDKSARDATVGTKAVLFDKKTNRVKAIQG